MGKLRNALASSSAPPVGWLTTAEMEAMPNRKTNRGHSEYALLLFVYSTGARVPEITQLKVRDLQLGRSNSGHDLADEILGRAADDAVFISKLGKPFTASGAIGPSSIVRPGRRNWRAER